MTGEIAAGCDQIAMPPQFLPDLTSYEAILYHITTDTINCNLRLLLLMYA
jgi:hypothetical protein